MPSRPAIFGAACLLVLAASPAISETFDYTNLWTHLSDTEMVYYQYDCGGLVDTVVKGNFAYAIDDHSGMQVVDCTDPKDTYRRGFVYLGDPRRCDIRDHYLYVLDQAPRIDILDVDDQDAPAVVAQLDLETSARELLVVGPWLYVASSDDNLRIYSLASATAPALVNTVGLPVEHNERLVLEGDRVIGAGDAGLVVLSAAVPEWPQILGSIAFTGNTRDLAVRGDLALVGQNDQSRLIDIADPAAMVERSTIAGESFGVCLTSNSQAWIGWQDCWQSGGLRVHDVSDPTSPQWLHDEINGFRGGPRAMVERDGLVYAAEWMCWCVSEWPGFHVFQVGDLPTPEPLAEREPDGGYGLLASESRIDVGTSSGVRSWDLSDPRNPQLVQTLGEEYGFRQLAEDDGLVAADRGGPLNQRRFQVLTRAADGSLALRGVIQIYTVAIDIDVSGSRALMLLYDQLGLWVIDLQDPDLPVPVAELFVDEDLKGVALHDDLAVVSTVDALLVLDLTDPQNPVELASVPHGTYWNRTELNLVEREGRLWLLTARNQGFNYDGGYAEVFDLTDPTAPQLAYSQRQLAMNAVGAPVWQGDLLVVPGTYDLTFYRCEDPNEPTAFLGRVPINDDLFDNSTRITAVIPTAVVSISVQDALQIWPLPEGVVTGVPSVDPVPAPPTLQVSAVPNPFNPICEFRVTVPAAGELTVEVFDARGRRVRRLGLDRVEAGNRAVRWDGRDDAGRPAPAGVYLARVRVGGHTASVKLTLAK